MGGSDLHIYGGFSLSPYLAMRVFEIVGEMASQSVDTTLSHVDDDNCEVCRKAAKAEEAEKEAADDAAQAGRPGREWTA